MTYKNKEDKLIHDRAYNKIWYQKNREKRIKQVVEYQKKNRKKIKQEMIYLLGGACSKCGYKKSIAALDFHHKKDKKFNIASLICNKSKKIVLEEVKKCILLCANCHRELHYKF